VEDLSEVMAAAGGGAKWGVAFNEASGDPENAEMPGVSWRWLIGLGLGWVWLNWAAWAGLGEELLVCGSQSLEGYKTQQPTK